MTPTMLPTTIPIVESTDAISTTGQAEQTTEQVTCDWTPISASECPSDDGRNLPDCSTSMSEGELCEADSTLPNGSTNYNINNCGSYDIFRYTCVSNVVTTEISTTQQTVSFTDHGAGECQTPDGSDPTHVY